MIPISERRSLVIYSEWKRPLRNLNLEQKGVILDALLDFPNEGNAVAEDPCISVAWGFIRCQLEENSRKWDEVREKRRESGRMGAEATNIRLRQKAANPANADFAETQSGKQRQSPANPANADFAETSIRQKAANPAVNVNVNVNDREETSPCGDMEKGADAPSPPTTQKRFVPPTETEAKEYFAEKGADPTEALRYLAFYESNGWKVGRNPMKNWRAAATNWIIRAKEEGRGTKPPERQWKEL